MSDFNLLALLSIAAFLLGAIFGNAFEDGNWINDCQKLGVHLNGDSVFACSKKEK